MLHFCWARAYNRVRFSFDNNNDQKILCRWRSLVLGIFYVRYSKPPLRYLQHIIYNLRHIVILL